MEKLEPVCVLLEKDVQRHESCKMAQPLWKSVCQFLTKLKMNLPYEPAMPFVGIQLEAGSGRDLYNHVPNSIIHNSQENRCNLSVH